jgi:hypothetical protein
VPLTAKPSASINGGRPIAGWEGVREVTKR